MYRAEQISFYVDMKKIKLKEKQKKFVDWYIKLANATEAAKRAGYSAKSAQEIASENLSKPIIQEYLQIRRSKYEELLGFNKATLIQDLHQIKSRCMQVEPVLRYDPKAREYKQVKEIVKKESEDGEVILVEEGVYQFDSNGAIRAVETINKMMGYNEPDKVEDVTPPEKKTPTVIINKIYDTKSDQSSSEAD